MSDLLPLENALERIASALKPLPAQKTNLLNADGCVLAQDCIAMRTQPPFAVSAMDGYALPHPAKAGNRYTVVGEVPAGGQFERAIEANEAVRIFTGAPVPAGANHVLIQEDALRNGDQLTVGAQAGQNANIRPQGGDFNSGDTLIAKGTVLTPQHLALAASGDHPNLLVHRRPKVAIIMNGDELVWPGTTGQADAIVASNGYALASLCKRWGADLVSLDCVPDDHEKLTTSIANAEADEADILVPIGGSSVGDYDLMRPALEQAGYQLNFPKVALRPGKPTVFGQKSGHVVLGLPGNPVSSIVSAMIFLPPIIKALAGKPIVQLLPLQDAILGADLPKNGPRAHFMRAVARETGVYSPVGNQDSSLLTRIANANALIYRAANEEPATSGNPCKIIPLPV